jgi:PPM family protein phosphatase
VAVTVAAAGQTDPGRVRANNEDAFLIDRLGQSTCQVNVGSLGVLLGVSDGVGGQLAGELASLLTLGVLRHCVENYLPGLAPHESLRRSVEDANAAVRAESLREPDHHGMAATLTAVLIHGNCAFVGAVGDSRAYLVRAGQVIQITHDQTFVQMLLDARAITPNQAAMSPHRNVILQAIGMAEQLDVAMTRVALRRGDRILLCTDGLSNTVSDEEMLEAIMRGDRLDETCARLIQVANTRAAEDNVTLVCAAVEGDLPEPRADEFIPSTFTTI